MKRNQTILIIIGVIIVLFVLINSSYSNNNSNDIRVAYIPCDHESALFVAEA
ncbi:hypothetical protein [Methanobacterium sp. SMA-27]|uniref:hypothetical protein n=1 Tax=Methanobacterium sp. SMA-27 TaxID=1495336 RepID=UPI001E46F6CB|nr:hypothetical protein [Methanobacterium sp. SMA-27]